MTERLMTVLGKISTVPNPVNSSLMQEFYQFMVYNRKSVAIRRTTMSGHSFTSHRSLRPAYCILLSHLHPNEAADLAAAISRASLGDADQL